MKWFSGDIASAITTAKSLGAIFVVYCEGKDEPSSQLTEIINNEKISKLLESNAFVAIKIDSDKEEYTQFAKIYQLVPVPSIFFIQNGMPLKIVTSALKSADELEETITSLIPKDITPTTTLAAEISQPVQESLSLSAATETVTITDPSSNTSVAEITANDTEDEKREKMEKARKIIEERRVARIKEEQQQEREREIQRRKEGQNVQNFKKQQGDLEMKQLREEQLRAKQVEKAARQRILDQIEQDKRDRALKFASPTTSVDNSQQNQTKVTPTTSAPQPTTSNSDQAKIQFKNPNGECEIVNFDSDIAFADLYEFVKSDLLKGVPQDFILATSFPRREFCKEDFAKTLRELNLTPSSVILIIFGRKPTAPARKPTSVQTQSGGGFYEMMSSVFFGVLTPILAFFAFLKGYFTRAVTDGSADDAGKRKRNEALSPNEAAKKRNLGAFQSPPEASTSGNSPTGAIPKSNVYKRSTNIHRLHENSDEDEDQKTYNGNSTQQL